MASFEKVDDRTNIRSPPVASAIRGIVAKEGGQHNDPSIVKRAHEIVKSQPPSNKRLQAPTFGWVAMWISEFGGTSGLDPLLRHADTYMNPSWSKGGLYYHRSDSHWDEKGNYTYVDPNTGNAAIAYARLNVKHGLKKMWDEPWTKDVVECRPHFDDLYFDEGVDCLRGSWDDEDKALIATFRSWDGEKKSIKPSIKRLPAATYGVYVDGCLKDVATVNDASEEVEVALDVGEENINLVVVREESIWLSTAM